MPAIGECSPQHARSILPAARRRLKQTSSASPTASPHQPHYPTTTTTPTPAPHRHHEVSDPAALPLVTPTVPVSDAETESDAEPHELTSQEHVTELTIRGNQKLEWVISSERRDIWDKAFMGVANQARRIQRCARVYAEEQVQLGSMVVIDIKHEHQVQLIGPTLILSVVEITERASSSAANGSDTAPKLYRLANRFGETKQLYTANQFRVLDGRMNGSAFGFPVAVIPGAERMTEVALYTLEAGSLHELGGKQKHRCGCITGCKRGCSCRKGTDRVKCSHLCKCKGICDNNNTFTAAVEGDSAQSPAFVETNVAAANLALSAALHVVPPPPVVAPAHTTNYESAPPNSGHVGDDTGTPGTPPPKRSRRQAAMRSGHQTTSMAPSL